MPDAICLKSNGCIFCNLFSGDMFTEVVDGVVFSDELTGPLVEVVIGVHVRPVCGNLTKFNDGCLGGGGCGGWCGDNEWGVEPACDCGGKRDGNFPLICGGGGNSGDVTVVGEDGGFRILCVELDDRLFEYLLPGRPVSSNVLVVDKPLVMLFSTIFLKSASERGKCRSSPRPCISNCWVIARVSPNLRNCCSTSGSSSGVQMFQ